MTQAPPSYTPQQLNAIITRQIRLTTFLALAQALVMMTAAGTLEWTLGWRYLFFYLAATVLITRQLALRDPALLAERVRVGAGAKDWDRLLARLIAVAAPLLIGLVAGLDRRFGWSQSLPDSLALAALFAAGLILLLLYRVMRANPFFSTTVRIQTERGHYVVSEGPYAVVRHPGYALMILYYLTHPLMLGSWWAFIPTVLTVALLVARTVLEDRVLQAELPGYRDYAAGMPYRLIPGIW